MTKTHRATTRPPAEAPSKHSDEAVLATISRTGPISARALLSYHPSLGDTISSTRLLKRLVEAGKLDCTQVRGRNAQYGCHVPDMAPPDVASGSAPGATSGRRSAETLANLERLMAFISKQKRPVAFADALTAFQAGSVTRQDCKRLLRFLVADRRLLITGIKRAARYRPSSGRLEAEATSAAAPAAQTMTAQVGGIPLMLATTIVDLIHMERRIYSELLAAATVSADPIVNRLARAAQSTRMATDALVK